MLVFLPSQNREQGTGQCLYPRFFDSPIFTTGSATGCQAFTFEFLNTL